MRKRKKFDLSDKYSKKNISIVSLDKCMDKEEFIRWYFSTTPPSRRQQKYIRIKK